MGAPVSGLVGGAGGDEALVPIGYIGAVDDGGEAVEIGMPPRPVPAGEGDAEATMGQREHRGVAVGREVVAHDRVDLTGKVPLVLERSVWIEGEDAAGSAALLAPEVDVDLTGFATVESRRRRPLADQARVGDGCPHRSDGVRQVAGERARRGG